MNTDVERKRTEGTEEMKKFIAQICGAILGVRCQLSSEVRTHDSIAEGLASAGVSFEREVRISSSVRLDFLCDGGVAIEVKLAGARKNIYRQVERYACEEKVKAVVVASAKSLRMPSIVLNKPVRVVSLSQAWL